MARKWTPPCLLTFSEPPPVEIVQSKLWWRGETQLPLDGSDARGNIAQLTVGLCLCRSPEHAAADAGNAGRNSRISGEHGAKHVVSTAELAVDFGGGAKKLWFL